MVEFLFLLSFLVELQSNCFHMNLETITKKDSLLFKKPFAWLSFLAPPLLHIVGLGFSKIILFLALLFFSSLFLPISSIDSKVQDLGQQDFIIVQDLDDIDVRNNYDDEEEEEEDGMIPDDESLIELSLPSGHYVGHHYITMSEKQDHTIIYKNHQIQDFRLIQLSSEFDEDDNMIEIDISIGSIKCSRLHIKA
ncbi:unnamed protein product [Cochlearia groenlandica]